MIAQNRQTGHRAQRLTWIATPDPSIRGLKSVGTVNGQAAYYTSRATTWVPIAHACIHVSPWRIQRTASRRTSRAFDLGPSRGSCTDR
jgi:hypothetical protein